MSDTGKFTKVLDDAGFTAAVAQGVSLVDFWAEWCGPCKMIAPALERLGERFAGKATIYKVNVDENPEAPAKFHVRGIPTLLVFKNGQLVDQVVGAAPEEAIAGVLARHAAG